MTATSKRNGFAWPNNARLAIAVTCLLENWSGDKGPPFSVQTTALKPGIHGPCRHDVGHLRGAGRRVAPHAHS